MKVQNERGEHIMNSAITISDASSNIVNVVSQTKRTNLTIEDVLNKLISTMKVFKFENNANKESNNIVSMLQEQKSKNEEGSDIDEQEVSSDEEPDETQET